MNQETNTVEFKLFNADLKKMSDAELEASLKELREITNAESSKQNANYARRRAA